MTVYTKAGLRIAEIYYDEPATAPKADIVRYRSRVQPDSRSGGTVCDALLIDLRQSPDDLLAGMKPETRKSIRRAGRESFTTEFFSRPDEIQTREFAGFYDRFADGIGIARANRERLDGLRRGGALALTRVLLDGEPLVYHAYLCAGTWAGGIYFASHFRDAENTGQAKLIGRANRYLHWSDMLRFRENGFETYDFGMCTHSSADEAKSRISDFKEGFGGSIAGLFDYDRGVTFRGALMLRLRQAALPFLRPR